MKVVTNCKTCRRLGISVCGRAKCALSRKPYPPGVHGKAFRRGLSEFGSQLREKQKIRMLYGLREQQFKNIVLGALRQKATGAPQALFGLLETRLDNVVYRLGLAPTRAAARQLVGHGHVMVNTHRVTAPSYRVTTGDEIRIRSQSVARGVFANLDLLMKKHTTPSWLSWDQATHAGHVVAHPSSEALSELGKGFNINAIVEYYSR